MIFELNTELKLYISSKSSHLKINSENMDGVVSEGNSDLRSLRVPRHASDDGRLPVPGAREAAHQVFVRDLRSISGHL